jgi:hypothetical protein
MMLFLGLALAAVVVLAGGFSAWILFALFMYAVFAIMRGPRRQRRRVRVAEPAQLGRSLPRLPAGTSGRLPVQVQVKAEQIRRKAQALMQYADRFPTGSEDLYVLERTVTEYLPTTLQAYLDLPPGYANAVVSADGKTALQSLWDQLELLDGKLDEIAQDVHRQNLDRLIANGRFLEERFGRRSSELDAVVARR